MNYATIGEILDRIRFHRESFHEAMRDFTREAKSNDYPIALDFGSDSEEDIPAK